VTEFSTLASRTIQPNNPASQPFPLAFPRATSLALSPTLSRRSGDGTNRVSLTVVHRIPNRRSATFNNPRSRITASPSSNPSAVVTTIVH
jgi:hypothetical protein